MRSSKRQTQQNTSQTQQQTQQRPLSMNNGYPQGTMNNSLLQGGARGYWRIDSKRNKWTFVPATGWPQSVTPKQNNSQTQQGGK